MVKNFIFLGAPGVGKGTIAAELMAVKGIIHISTGDIFRKEIAKGSPLGMRVKSLLDSGEYVPDDITNEIVLKALNEDEVKAKGFILDGYPRTLNQAEFLEQNFVAITNVFLFEVPFPVVLERLLNRGRPDDTEAVIKHRYDVYNDKTKPLIDYYEKRGLIRSFEASGGVKNTVNKVLEVIE